MRLCMALWPDMARSVSVSAATSPGQRGGARDEHACPRGGARRVLYGDACCMRVAIKRRCRVKYGRQVQGVKHGKVQQGESGRRRVGDGLRPAHRDDSDPYGQFPNPKRTPSEFGGWRKKIARPVRNFPKTKNWIAVSAFPRNVAISRTPRSGGAGGLLVSKVLAHTASIKK